LGIHSKGNASLEAMTSEDVTADTSPAFTHLTGEGIEVGVPIGWNSVYDKQMGPKA
jgi:hypothetical protein